MRSIADREAEKEDKWRIQDELDAMKDDPHQYLWDDLMIFIKQRLDANVETDEYTSGYGTALDSVKEFLENYGKDKETEEA
jgi:hypothetical protein